MLCRRRLWDETHALYACWCGGDEAAVWVIGSAHTRRSGAKKRGRRQRQRSPGGQARTAPGQWQRLPGISALPTRPTPPESFLEKSVCRRRWRALSLHEPRRRRSQTTCGGVASGGVARAIFPVAGESSGASGVPSTSEPVMWFSMRGCSRSCRRASIRAAARLQDGERVLSKPLAALPNHVSRVARSDIMATMLTTTAGMMRPGMRAGLPVFAPPMLLTARAPVIHRMPQPMRQIVVSVPKSLQPHSVRWRV